MIDLGYLFLFFYQIFLSFDFSVFNVIEMTSTMQAVKWLLIVTEVVIKAKTLKNIWTFLTIEFSQLHVLVLYILVYCATVFTIS